MVRQLSIYHPGANGNRPANILSCGGAACILFGAMRLLSSEEKGRSAKRKAEAEEAKKSKKSKKSKTKRQQPSAGGVAKLLELAEGAAQARALPSE